MSPSTPRPDNAFRWGRQHGIAILVILGFAGYLGWRARAPAVGVGGDEASYLILSESVRHFRYRDEHLVGTPPHAKYPPGNPTWIAIVQGLAGPDLEPLRAANLVLLAIAALLLADGVRRVAGPWAGIGTLALVALSPPLHGIFGSAMSEAPFVFLTVFSIWATLRHGDLGATGWGIAASVAAIAAFLTRTAGLATIGAVGIGLLVAGRRRAAVIHALAGLAVVGTWFGYAWRAARNGAVMSYAGDLDHLGEGGGTRISGLGLQLLRNARDYLEGLPWILGLPTFGDSALAVAAWTGLIIAASGLGFVVLIRRWPAGAAYLVLFAMVLMAWPWFVPRLAVPLVPILAVAGVLGSVAVAGRIGPRFRPMVGIAVGLASGLTAWSSFTRHQRLADCDRRDPYRSAACFPEAQRSFVAAARTLGAEGSTAVIATAKPAPLHFFGGVTTIHVETIIAAERASGTLTLPAGGAGLILLGNLHPTERELAAPMLARHCRELEVRHVVSATTLVMGARQPASEDACGALARYRQEADR